jgi:hypothetical protein
MEDEGHWEASGAPAESYREFDWNDFVKTIFSYPPKEPFTYRMELLDHLDSKGVSQLLGQMLIIGAKQLYTKEISQLTPDEIENIQNYYRSLGFEVEYEIKSKIQYVSELKKTMPVNYFHIDFKSCSTTLDRRNQPDRLF